MNMFLKAVCKAGLFVAMLMMPLQNALAQFSEGAYRIENRLSGKVLDVAGVSTENAANIQQYACWGGRQPAVQHRTC